MKYGIGDTCYVIEDDMVKRARVSAKKDGQYFSVRRLLRCACSPGGRDLPYTGGGGSRDEQKQKYPPAGRIPVKLYEIQANGIIKDRIRESRKHDYAANQSVETSSGTYTGAA